MQLSVRPSTAALRVRGPAAPAPTPLTVRRRRCATVPSSSSDAAAAAGAFTPSSSPPEKKADTPSPAHASAPAPAHAGPSNGQYAGGPAPPPVAGGPANDNFSGDMLKPSVVNTPLVRAAAVVGAVAVVAGSTVLLPGTIGAFLHVTSYAVLLGTQLWNTFFVGLTMFKNLPRQTFGRVQSKLFPMYFSLTAGANLLALATAALAGAGANPAGTRALAALGVSLAGLLFNWLYLEPLCTKLMFDRYDLENLPEKTEDDKAKVASLYKEFGKWHGISSLVNLVSFCVAVSHGWFLASLLTI
ncbi:hypothetical protein HYH03_007229 [Edaphochlamys debaryana]|uniref:TMEM205-like domain-containing protein n=1 Tax=Edaphochlamys debaryana TaxID=47281 RepID=A0A835Y2G5_9CHLO|nr:hypothetical protein HYH03_007229 [Edaphochlamys debaryana]|eukprot:KAG2494715.1 hypothetical protein HYH03_007229 [Edaphochlamys debaryana]